MKNHSSLYQSRIAPFLANARRVFGVRFNKNPIQTVETLMEFVQTRSAYVAQTSLYGYLKTRMGTRYPHMFKDEVFSVSINNAKWRVYGSCLSDLTVFAAGTAAAENRMNDLDTVKLARFIFHSTVQNTFDDEDAEKPAAEALENFDKRVDSIVWVNMPIVENAFTSSPSDLINWAPVVDEFKEYDREIVTNSIRFRWRDIREQLRKRIDSDAVCNSWRNRE